MIRKISLFGITDVGLKRTHNEDDFAICKNIADKSWGFKRDEILSLSKSGALLIVADGMGGTNAGEVASHLAQQAVKEDFDNLAEVPATLSEREDFLKKSILRAHQAVVNHQHQNLDTAGMGTTLVIAWIISDSVYVAWSGDSRCYIYNGQDFLYPFTDDHSLVWQMVEEEKMTPEEARVHPESNIVTQSLGDEKNPPDPYVKTTRLFENSRLILCSDGLNGMLSDEYIKSVLDQDKSISETCQLLVKAANKAGGEDNITCLMLEVNKGAKSTSNDITDKKQEKKPTKTQVLRKKNSFKNIIILFLVFVLCTIAVLFYPWKTSGELTPGIQPEQPVLEDTSDENQQNIQDREIINPSDPEGPATEEPNPDTDADTENLPGNTPVQNEVVRPSESAKDSLRHQAPAGIDSTATVKSEKEVNQTPETEGYDQPFSPPKDSSGSPDTLDLDINPLRQL